jgi:N6-adenosine-specific RNA methylase IME4
MAKQGPPYNVVYSDPPWPVFGELKEEKDFPLMSYEDIEALDVASVVADDAYLFLWIMQSTLPHAARVMEAWGFQYKGLAFVWEKIKKEEDKPAMGFGYYTRPSVELCLLGIRGKPTRLPARAKNVMQVQRVPRAGLRYAEKPAIVRDEIVRLCGNLPRLEMFARRMPPGWHVWGNEVECSVMLGDKREKELLG